MSNSYRTLIERLRQFADGHYIIQKFYHGQIDAADLDKEPRYPMMHVLPVDIRASEGTLDYALEIRFADIGRDKEIKTDYQKEIISDMSRIALSLISEIENGEVLFGNDAEIVDKQATIIPFIEEFTHVLTGVQLNVTIRLPFNWSACDIPADYSPNITDNPTTGSGILTKIGIYNDGDFVGYTSFVDFSDEFNVSINGNKIEVTLVGGGGSGVLTAIPFSADHITANGNAYAIGDLVYYSGNVYRCIANNDSILPSSTTYWTNLGTGYPLVERPIDWNATSGNNQILNKPTIPTNTSELTNDGEDGVNPFITALDIPAQVNSDWNATSGVAEILNKPDLSDVDNTSDANKPVSTAQQTALNLKKDKAEQRIFETTSNQNSTSTTRANVTELTVPMLAGKKYRIELFGMMQSPAVTTGCSVGFYLSAGTATINGIIRGLVQTSASTTALDQFINVLTTTAGATGSFFITSGVGAINKPHALGGSFYVESASDCDFKVQFGSEIDGASTTLLSGSAIIVDQLN